MRWNRESSGKNVVELYERAAMSMDATPFVRLVFGVLVAIGLYLTYVGWAAKPASPSA
jgi:hypothetical protein